LRVGVQADCNEFRNAVPGIRVRWSLLIALQQPGWQSLREQAVAPRFQTRKGSLIFSSGPLHGEDVIFFDCEPMTPSVLNFHTALQLFRAARNGKLRYSVYNQKILVKRFATPRRPVLSRGCLRRTAPKQSTNKSV
jgi:hypothetical protein